MASANEIEDTINKVLHKYYDVSMVLKDQQIQCIKFLVEGDHLCALLPTGFGKSLIYTLFPLVLQELTKQPKTALVISPLKALMEDQVNALAKHNIKAGALMSDVRADTFREIKDGKMSIGFASPESVMMPHIMRVLRQQPLKDQLCLIAFDEAHCISEWGIDFREEYRRVSELISVFDDIPTCLLSATLTKEIQADLYSLLSLPQDTKVVAVLPDRPNIFLHVEKAKDNYELQLPWILDQLQSKKILVYCKSVRSCQNMYIWAMEKLGEVAFANKQHIVSNRIVEMFHSRSDSETSKRILEEFPKPESKIKLLFSTIAFGMGVQLSDIDVVVNWGVESTTLSFWQEVGRCARDGRRGLSVMYALKRSLNTCKDETMKSIGSAASCIRELVLDKFHLEGMHVDVKSKAKCVNNNCTECSCPFCMCCSNCVNKCNCSGKLTNFLDRV